MKHPWRKKNLTKMKWQDCLSEINPSVRVDNKLTRNQTFSLDLGVDVGLEQGWCFIGLKCKNFSYSSLNSSSPPRTGFKF